MPQNLMLLIGIVAIVIGYWLLLVDPNMDLQIVNQRIFVGIGVVAGGAALTIWGLYIRSYRKR